MCVVLHNLSLFTLSYACQCALDISVQASSLFGLLRVHAKGPLTHQMDYMKPTKPRRLRSSRPRLVGFPQPPTIVYPQNRAPISRAKSIKSSSPMDQSKRVVVCGGGVIGVCTAYFLGAKGAVVTLIEMSDVACAASGKAGGFLAYYCCPAPLPHTLGSCFLTYIRLWEVPYHILNSSVRMKL
ncbi:unnamed protein product [Sphenostylis stenocarpa]|uniref:FAD dependent oxidoreductase domain-containing protein n=1 Tax=Sphenostylis stenocarpa TaxID=92480 RepID=A0AA86RXD7_9FABA|nr:unnamed protein product [Sphenostylis stenocarpa]